MEIWDKLGGDIKKFYNINGNYVSTKNGKILLKYLKTKDTEIVIPDEIEKIGEKPFEEMSIKNLF